MKITLNNFEENKDCEETTYSEYFDFYLKLRDKTRKYLLNSYLDNNATCENTDCYDCPFYSKKLGINGICSGRIFKIKSVLGIQKTPPIKPQYDYSLYNCGEVFNWLVKQIKYKKLDIE